MIIYVFKFDYLSYYIGILIVLFILYIRVRERKDHDVLFQYNLLYIIFVFGVLLFYLYLFFSLFKNEIKISPFINKLKEIFYKALNDITKLWGFINPSMSFTNLANLFYYILSYKLDNLFSLIYYFLFLLPRFTLAMSLFLDIVILHHMHYLYKFIFLAWIPLSLRVLLYLTWFWSQEFFEHFFKTHEEFTEIIDGEEYTITRPIEEKESEFLYDSHIYSIKRIEAKVFELFYQKVFEAGKSLLFKCLIGFIYLIYIITWSYVLFKIIHNY